MRLTPEDVRSEPEAPDSPPTSRTWRLEIAVAVLGLLAGLAIALYLL